MSDNEWERIGASIDAAIEGRTKLPKPDTDLREQVARAIWKCEHKNAYGNGALARMADAAIAVVIEELAQRAEDYSGTIVWRYETDRFAPEDGSLADWLRAQE